MTYAAETAASYAPLQRQAERVRPTCHRTKNMLIFARVRLNNP